MSISPYQEAGNLLQEVIVNRRGLKSAAFSGNKKKKGCSKSAYAQACKTLRHKGLLDQILNLNEGRLYKAVKVDDCKNQGLLYVLLFELLFGINQKIRGGGALKRYICKVETELRDAKQIVVGSSEDDDDNNNNILPAAFPRYVRINTLKDNSKNVIQLLQQQLPEDDEQGNSNIYRDRHVPNLLVLSPNSNIPWYKHPLVIEGHVVLQDKSSCFSALALVHGSGNAADDIGIADDGGCDFIDACAAPGNKTTHLAALVALARETNTTNTNHSAEKGKKKNKKNNKQHPAKNKSNIIFALDKSDTRIKILQDRVPNLVPSSPSATVEVQSLHEDFLNVMPDDPTYENVKAILLDPSCSGSGIINSIDRFYLDQQQQQAKKNNPSGGDEASSTPQKSRVQTIASFQRLALLHAMSFPNLKRIVYSTCSIHEEENEIVAASALHEHNARNDEYPDQKWKIVAPIALNGWTRRGHTDIQLSEDVTWTEEDAKSCVRVDGRKGDETNGFFVACFERKDTDNTATTTKEFDKTIIEEATTDNELRPLYDHEFQKISTEKPKKVQVPKKVEKDDSPVPTKGKSSKAPLKVKAKAPPANKKEDKMTKKRAKKSAWKVKQKEQKLMRMLKIESEKDDTGKTQKAKVQKKLKIVNDQITEVKEKGSPPVVTAAPPSNKKEEKVPKKKAKQTAWKKKRDEKKVKKLLKKNAEKAN